jgi:glycosyltransferase involved in cell wall biosynthesis
LLLSVVIPVYRQSYALRQTLSSLAAQSLPTDQFEVIVVDDCSPVPVTDQVAEFAGALSVRCVRHPVNRGRAVARNTGAAAARADLLLFLDADSVAHPKLLERHLAAHTDGHDRVLLGRRVESDWGTASRFADPGTLSETVSLDQDDMRLGSEVGVPGVLDSSPWVFVISHNFSMPRRIFDEVGGFDEAFDRWGWEDTELGYRLFLHWDREPGRFTFLPEATCYHVPHYSNFFKNYTDAVPGLAHLKAKHEHWEVERLGFHPRLQALNMPVYRAFLERHADASAGLTPELERHLPTADRRLFAGRGASGLAGRPAATMDVTAERTETNKPLIGMHTRWADGSFDDVVHWENWRVLNVSDVADLIDESLRLAPTLYLAGTAAPIDGHPVARPADVLGSLQTAPFEARQIVDTDSLWVLEVRARTAA